MMALRSTTVLFVYVLLSLAVGIYEAARYRFGAEASLQFELTWSLVALMLVVFWIELDCLEQETIGRPFDFGFLLLIFWPFYLPYHLFRTRGAYAVVWLVGFVGLSFLGVELEWLVWLAR